MNNYTTATVEGHVTHVPILKKTKTGKNVLSFSLAVNHYSADESAKKVSYIDIETWDKLAEIASKHITKGRRLMVFGTLRQDRWEGIDGKKQSKIKVVGKEIRYLESLSKPVAETELKAG
jgi:single-strand DNA-binding protein